MENEMSPKIKSFWERKEGFTGMLFGFVGVALLGWGLIAAMPTLIALATNTITLIGLGVALAAIIAVISDKKFWILAWAMYQSLMKAITGVFVTIDPIGIIENYIKELKKKIERINTELENLKAQQRSVETAINDSLNRKKQALLLAKQAQKIGNESALQVNAREAERQEEFAKKMQFVLDKIILLYKMLSKIMENSQTILTDTENEVNIKKRERSMWKATSSAIKSAQSIIIGDPDQRALFDASMEEVAEDIAKKNGEMDRFVDRTRAIMDNIDLNNGVMQEKGLELLRQFESESGSILISDKDKKRILADASFISPKKKSADVEVGL